MQKFNYHSHTYRCGHAELTMKDEDYIKEYIQMGFKKMAFTDHCPEKNEIDKRDDMRMSYSQKDEYLNSIKALKEKYADKIEIKSGFEVEYLPGEEENIRELKEDTDIIVLGQHFIYDDNKNLKIFWSKDYCTDEEIMRYAEYLENAMKLGIPDIVAHPDTYMTGRKEFGEVESKVASIICKSAEKYNIPLEINLAQIFNNTYNRKQNGKRVLNDDPLEKQKERLSNIRYPIKEFWEIASNYNIRVLYGIDAHFRGQILRFNELVELATEIIGKETIDKLNFVSDI